MSRVIDDLKSASAKEYSRHIDNMIAVMNRAIERIDQLEEACKLYKQSIDAMASCCGCEGGEDKEIIADLLASGEAEPVAEDESRPASGPDAPTTGDR